MGRSARQPGPRSAADGRSGSLGHIGPDARAAVPALIRSLDDNDEFVHSAAAAALGKIGPAAAVAVPAMIKALEASSYFHQGIIGPAIAGIGPAAVPALTTVIRHKTGLRWPAIRALGLMGPPAKEAAPILDQMLSVREDDVREQAAFALWEIVRRRDAIEVIIDCTTDENESPRIGAADHLGETRARRGSGRSGP